MSGPNRLHHIAFGTRDVDATVDFYANRLGMPLVHTENHLSGEGWFRHFFFEIGNGEYLGFFAFENVGERPEYRTDISTGLGVPPWINHVAFNVENREALETMKARCRAHDVKISGEMNHGWCESIYLMDPNGILVEFTTSTNTGEFGMSSEKAAALLRQPPESFAVEARKEMPHRQRSTGSGEPS